MLNIEEIQSNLNKNNMQQQALKDQLKALEDISKDLREKKALILYHEKCITYAKQFFEWTKRDGHEGKTFFEYETPTYEFCITLKHRTDLKVWKYEMKTNIKSKVYELRYDEVSYYTDYNTCMSKYLNHKYNTELSKHEYHEIDLEFPTVKKFKDVVAARQYVEQWKKRLQADFRKEISEEKELFRSVRSRYNQNRIIICLENFKERQSFREYASHIGLTLVEKRMQDNLIVEGDQAKEKVLNLIQKYGFKAEIKAS